MQVFITIVFSLVIFFNINNADANLCAFCKEETIENQAVFQSEYFNVLIDYEPRVRGHLLVIPKRHLAKAHELSKAEWAELSTIIPKAVEVFSQVLHTDQYIILEKNGPRAFQNVPHVHFHLFPVTSQTWAEIFDIVPQQLSKEELEKEVTLFRSFFFLNNILQKLGFCGELSMRAMNLQQITDYATYDLKVTDFKPEFARKMNFYLWAVDDQMKHSSSAA